MTLWNNTFVAFNQQHGATCDAKAEIDTVDMFIFFLVKGFLVLKRALDPALIQLQHIMHFGHTGCPRLNITDVVCMLKDFSAAGGYFTTTPFHHCCVFSPTASYDALGDKTQDKDITSLIFSNADK